MTFSEDRWTGALRVARASFAELEAPGDAGRFIVVFFVDSEPGFGMVTAQRAKDLGVSREEAARKVREVVSSATGDLCMSSVLTVAGLGEMFADLGVTDEALLAEVAALAPALGAAEPAGQGHVLVLTGGKAEARAVPLVVKHEARFAGEAATDAERDARLETVLQQEGAGHELMTKLRDLFATGVAPRNAGVYIEREVDGKRHVIVGYRTGIAAAIEERVGKKARIGAVLEMLKGRPKPGNVFCVFVLWREDGLTDIACVEVTPQKVP